MITKSLYTKHVEFFNYNQLVTIILPYFSNNQYIYKTQQPNT